MFSVLKAVTDLDPTGISSKAVDVANTTTRATVGLAGLAAEATVEAVSDPVTTVGSAVDTGVNILEGAIDGVGITVAGIEIEVDGKEATDLIYNALVPKTAQAVLRGEMPSRGDFVDDAIGWVGGPIEGVYVGANSQTAAMLAQGRTPPAEQVGRDMVEALTPVAKRRLGL